MIPCYHDSRITSQTVLHTINIISMQFWKTSQPIMCISGHHGTVQMPSTILKAMAMPYMALWLFMGAPVFFKTLTGGARVVTSDGK